MQKLETKGRARALQLLYAWEIGSGEPMEIVATGVARLTGPEPRVLDFAESLASRVVANLSELDRHAAAASDHWRLDRLALIERNILRLGTQELIEAVTPPKVVIDEAVQLAHWFGGARAPAFVNGVLDRIARSLGRL